MKPQIYDATTELDDKIKLRVFPKSRNVQEPKGIPAGDPARDSAGELREAPRQHVQSDHLLQKQDVKKLMGDCEITDAGCQDIADIVKVKDTIEELDLPKNTKSSKKYKITIDESAETVEKTKTTINNIVMYYHDEATHPGDVHEE